MDTEQVLLDADAEIRKSVLMMGTAILTFVLVVGSFVVALDWLEYDKEKAMQLEEHAHAQKMYMLCLEKAAPAQCNVGNVNK